MTSADYARKQGFKVGDILEGTEYSHCNGGTYSYHSAIRIVFLGEDLIVAKTIESNGKKVDGEEGIWDLRMRDWKVREV